MALGAFSINARISCQIAGVDGQAYGSILEVTPRKQLQRHFANTGFGQCQPCMESLWRTLPLGTHCPALATTYTGCPTPLFAAYGLDSEADRFDTLRSRLSAAHTGINMLVLRERSKDWYWKATVQELDADEMAHHIFPRPWCEHQKIWKSRYDSILNKTPISHKANRKIGGEAPSRYLPRLQAEKHVALNGSEMNKLLASHALAPDLMRLNAFDDFMEDRRKRLSQLVEEAMGKPVVHVSDRGDYD